MRKRTMRRLGVAVVLVALVAAAVISAVMLKDGGTAGSARDEGEFPPAFSRHLEQLKKASPGSVAEEEDPRALWKRSSSSARIRAARSRWQR